MGDAEHLDPPEYFGEGIVLATILLFTVPLSLIAGVGCLFKSDWDAKRRARVAVYNLAAVFVMWLLVARPLELP